jgi:small subunit ribosomal protein S20
MPQLQAAKKALRASARRRAVNDRWRVRFRASIRAVTDALQSKDTTKALEAFHKAQSLLDRAARRNVIHPNTAARKKSRLQKAIASQKSA